MPFIPLFYNLIDYSKNSITNYALYSVVFILLSKLKIIINMTDQS